MKKTFPKKQSAGFALIVTLSLMILLTVIAVGLLSLSSISLRATGQSAADSTARNNARLAMMLALGELQASLGPDKGVSAPAAAVVKSAARPHLTGAWESWRWTPVASGSPSFSEKAALFRGWLVSTNTPEDAKNFSLAAGNEPSGNNAVTLVGSATNPLTDAQGIPTTVAADKITVGSKQQPGKLAWAVFDESTKASIGLGDPLTKQTPGEEIASRTVPARFRADTIDSKLGSLKNPQNLVTLETATIAGGVETRPEFRKRFHDLTTSATGLLTNTADGGLKTDLTSLFEADSLPNNAFPADSPYLNFPVTAGAPKWTYIRDHYRKYKAITSAAAGESSYTLSKTTDLKINPDGVTPSPDNERLLPVVAKFQLVFSLVAHWPIDMWGRRQFYNGNGGYTNFGVIDLVYDPVITLYNPYDVSLNLSKSRIRVWDPPVGFRFKKIASGQTTGPYFRPGGEFLGLARFQTDKESNPNARKCFTLSLTDGTDQAAGNSLRLKPGEVKVFSPRVNPDWTWVWEGVMPPKAFFDWNINLDFGNADNRTGNKFGIETVPGWQSRAGLQTDNLATRNPRRDPSTNYDFENNANQNEGIVTIRTSDSVQVEATPTVTAASSKRQFQLDILAGESVGSSTTSIDSDTSNAGVKEDTLRSYIFNFTNPAAEISAEPNNAVISHQFKVGDIIQTDSDTGPGGKKPFAMLEMSARTTKDELTDSKPWLYNNFVVEGAEQDTTKIGLTHQGYDLRFREMTSFNSFPGIEIDPDTKRGYFGASGSVNEGSSFVSMMHVPEAPAASLGDLIPTNLIAGSLMPRVVHPFGNSRAHPLVPAGKVSNGPMLDHSYLLNDALWDAYYFSSLTTYGGATGGVMKESLSLKTVLTDLFDGTKPALNNRLAPVTSEGASSTVADKIVGLSDLDRSRQLAKYVTVNGSFNVNSTSVDAWQAVLSSLRDREVNGLEIQGAAGASLRNKVYSNADLTPFVRTGKPLANSTPPSGLLWAGYRALTDAQIKELARLIVEEITLRGVKDSAPSLSLGEFVNRRPDSATAVQSLAGLLQTAIDKSTLNNTAKTRDSKTIVASAIPAQRKKGAQTSQVMDGESAEGAPSMLTQGDLMAALAPIATVRGDTFKIRSYGEATAPDGTTVLARAWCETVVQRMPNFVDPSEAPETAITALQSPANKTFGREFHIISFRWLNKEEI